MHNDMITDYANLALGAYLDIQRINEDESRELVDRQVAILSILSGKTEREILNLPIAEYGKLAAAADFLTKPAEKVPRPASKYKLGAFTLVPVSDLRKVTTAQYIDFQSFAPDAERRLVELLSVSLVPEGMTYNDGYDVLDVQRAIRDELSVQDALALVADFFARWLALTRATLNSLAKEMRNTKRVKDATKRAALQAEIAARQKQLQALSKPVGDGLRKWTS